LADIGYQPTQEGPKRKVALGFELLGETTEADEPVVLYRTCNVTLGPKSTLRGIVEALQGRKLNGSKDFDIVEVVNRPCSVKVSHTDETTDGKVYANIDSVSPLKEGQTAGPARSPVLIYSMDDPDDFARASLPSWIRDRIEKSLPVETGQASLPKAKKLSP
jgi:hypothetical protein